MKTHFARLSEIFQSEGNLVSPDDPERVVFVGDTHGDLEASRIVFERYFDDRTVLTFLGDYVDRGRSSKENLDFLLEQKLDHPKKVFLLQGNHEGLKFRSFGPVDFWNSLSSDVRKAYMDLTAQFPLVFSWKKLLAVHGGLPDLSSEGEINQIEGGDPNWEKITWGDFNEVEGFVLGGGLGRPQLGRDYFDQAMANLDKEILIRAHQPDSPTYMFGNRCLTIFTSAAYGRKRSVAIANSSVSGGKELKVEKL